MPWHGIECRWDAVMRIKMRHPNCPFPPCEYIRESSQCLAPFLDLFHPVCILAKFVTSTETWTSSKPCSKHIVVISGAQSSWMWEGYFCMFVLFAHCLHPSCFCATCCVHDGKMPPLEKSQDSAYILHVVSLNVSIQLFAFHIPARDLAAARNCTEHWLARCLNCFFAWIAFECWGLTWPLC